MNNEKDKTVINQNMDNQKQATEPLDDFEEYCKRFFPADKPEQIKKIQNDVDEAKTFGQQFRSIVMSIQSPIFEKVWETGKEQKDPSLFLERTVEWPSVITPIKGGLIKNGKKGLEIDWSLVNSHTTDKFFLTDDELKNLELDKSRKSYEIKSLIDHEIYSTRKYVLTKILFERCKNISNLSEKKLKLEIQEHVFGYYTKTPHVTFRSLGVEKRYFKPNHTIKFENYTVTEEDMNELNKQVFAKLTDGFSDRVKDCISTMMNEYNNEYGYWL